MKRGWTQVRVFLKKLGMAPRRVGPVPAKADPVEPRRFLDQELQPLLDEAVAGKRAVWFVDGAHFLHAAILGMVWSFVRLFIRSPSGRKRYNILGAVNAVTKQMIWVSSIGTINQSTLVELIKKILAHQNSLSLFQPLARPITLVLDNARYQHARWVKNVAAFFGIQLLYLPTYSPNLNLIERVWKYIRKELVSCYYYPTFTAFAAAIERAWEEANTIHHERMQTLLTLKFQMFDEVPVLAA
jgi:transposase